MSRKMCDIIKEIRSVASYGDKSDKTIAKRMLNGLYGESTFIEEIERITLLQYLKTFDCGYNGVYLTLKENWYGIPCSVDLGHFNVVKDTTIFSSATLVKDDDITFAPQELYNLYIDKAERNPVSMCYHIVLTDKYYFDTDSIKGEANGNNN